ncbi:ABC transporter ATP-binding protein [Actinomadura sp. 7K507]|uniref:ABC transporter ATP-binding protein n=1 Tax=Actinomadura sp. 7K507 TaxID=2530365 RepID=UPI00104DD167|nr:ABC transporter ATP-binding protein [Actinomadura sp. 7K507]TDC85703.1 ABC transporter ATP-binding protein [Actinomadura sp. 7K507]
MTLELHDVRKRFGGVVASDGVTFRVGDGEIFGLIGPNGAGKTTVVNLITAYMRPDDGQIRFEDTEITRLKPGQLAARGVSRTFQSLRLFEGVTVVDNVLIGRHRWFKGQVPLPFLGGKFEKAQRAAALEWADFVGLGDVAAEPVDNLPYGLRRKVEIARALALEPRLLLLDEPTAGMTRTESDEVAGLIRRIREHGITVLLIDHNISLVNQVCDRVAVLDFGKVIAEDEPKAIWQNELVRRAYLGDDEETMTGADS